MPKSSVSVMQPPGLCKQWEWADRHLLGFRGVLEGSELQVCTENQRSLGRKLCPGDRPGFPGKTGEEWAKGLQVSIRCTGGFLDSTGVQGGFLTVKLGLQRESLVEELSRRAWQEIGGAEPDGNKKKENTNEQRNGPHLVSGPT